MQALQDAPRVAPRKRKGECVVKTYSGARWVRVLFDLDARYSTLQGKFSDNCFVIAPAVSGSGSEHSAGSSHSDISTKNTLLAGTGGATGGSRKAKSGHAASSALNKLQPDMQIDTAQLTNPDSLWQRRQSAG